METQDSIETWAALTFVDSDRSALGIATRMNVEVAELLLELVGGGVSSEHRVALECADIMIVLAQVAARYDYLLMLDPIEPHHNGEYRRASLATKLELAATINVKSAELLSALQHKADRTILVRLMQDIAWRTVVLCHRHLHNIQQAINEKMAINRKRSWVKHESGRMQHA